MKDQIVAATGLVLLLLAFGAEAKVCSSISHTWKGRCMHSLNCAATCTTEGDTGGYCKGTIDRVCMCTKDCHGNHDSTPPPSHPIITPAPKVVLPPHTVAPPNPVLSPPIVVLPPPNAVLPPHTVAPPNTVSPPHTVAPPDTVLPPPRAVLPPPYVSCHPQPGVLPLP